MRRSKHVKGNVCAVAAATCTAGHSTPDYTELAAGGPSFQMQAAGHQQLPRLWRACVAPSTQSGMS